MKWASSKVLDNQYGSLDGNYREEEINLLAYNNFMLDRFKTCSLYSQFLKKSAFFMNLGFNI